MATSSVCVCAGTCVRAPDSFPSFHPPPSHEAPLPSAYSLPGLCKKLHVTMLVQWTEEPGSLCGSPGSLA